MSTAAQRHRKRVRRGPSTGSAAMPLSASTGMSKADYARDLESHLQDLHERLRTQRYRHQPIRRVYIPKEGRPGQRRALGVSCFEDKLVQGALRELLEVIYEPLFRPCS